MLFRIISIFHHENVQYKSFYFLNWVFTPSYNVHMIHPTFRSCRLCHRVLNGWQFPPCSDYWPTVRNCQNRNRKTVNMWMQVVHGAKQKKEQESPRTPNTDLILSMLCCLHIMFWWCWVNRSWGWIHSTQAFNFICAHRCRTNLVVH